MEFVVVGLNHQTASTSIRESATFTDSQKIETLALLMDQGLPEVVILSTCGRSEIYCATPIENYHETTTLLVDFFESYCQQQGVKDHLYIKRGERAIEHLIHVSTGLNSIVLGEDQILGQVKAAHVLSMEMGASKKVLNTLFRDAISGAKKVKTTLKISEIPLSISYLGISVLKRHFGNLEGKSVMIIGLGKMGELAFKYLLSEGVKLTVCARNLEKLKAFQSMHPVIEILPYADRLSVLDQHDIIISATSAPHLVLHRLDFTGILRPIVLMDLSLPRDIEEDVRLQDNVQLFNMDDLQRLSEDNSERRKNLLSEAHLLLSEDVDKMTLWLKNVKLDTAIKDLNLMIKDIELDTMKYIDHKLSLNIKERILVEKALQSALKRTIRKPLLNIKMAAETNSQLQYLEAISLLYSEGEE